MRLLIPLLLMCFLPCAAWAQSWQSSTKSFSPSADSSISNAWRYSALLFDASGVKKGAVVMSASPLPYANAAATLSLPSYTRAYDFYIQVGRLYNADDSNYTGTVTYNGAQVKRWIPLYWVSAYKVGDPNEPQQSASGPTDNNGNPTDDNGNPADPVTGQPPNNSHKACITLACPASALEAKAFRVTGKVGTNIIYDQIVTVTPGETRKLCVTNDGPFTLTAQEVYSKDAFNPDLDAISGSDPNKPEDWSPSGSPQTVNSTGQTTPPPSSPEATNEKTGQTGSADRPAAQSVTRPGTAEGNSDARNQELRNELQRLTDQVKTSGDATKSGIDETNKLLGKLSEGGDSGTGPALGTPSAAGTGFAGSIQGKASGLGSALAGLAAAAGLTASPGTNALTWEIPVMGANYTINLETHADVFSTVRSAILWVASAFFVWAAFGILRGAFVDEGK